MPIKKYNPQFIENKWLKIWEKEDVNLTSVNIDPHKKKYVLDMFPYPSGAGLHVGHPEGYTATDIYTRYLRMKGFFVLHPMGWDAFGLPAENYAIKTGVHPAISTKKNIETYKKQIKRLGLSYDWEREINTSDPKYYKWTQWLFIKLYQNKLAYRNKAPVNWCPNCQTVLANEQVKDGKCNRCETIVLQKDLEQWFFKITNYAEQLVNGLDGLNWPEPIKLMQKNWIGKSEGAEVEFRIKNSELKIKVFTTRPDTLYGSTYLVISPESEIISNLESRISNLKDIEEYIKKAKLKTDIQRTDLNKDKSGVELKGITAINPVNDKEIPIWIADYVLSSYGTGAIMAVPAHDKRDFEFAKKYNLEIKRVISGGELPNAENGILVNSDEFNGIESAHAISKISKKVGGNLKINYKLRDWLISRQRYWGAPIPIIYCDKCGILTVPEDQLPVELPNDVDFTPTGESPLVNSKSFHKVNCPKCHSPARRESDTMDTFVDSSWYFLRYIDPNNDVEFASKEKLNKWLPVDMYVGGAEHAVMHLLYARFITKALRVLGYIDFDEPFTSLKNQGLILAEDGRKMSKSLGNVINPDDIVAKFGADTFRLYEMFMGPLEVAKPWSTRSMIGLYRFLEKLWNIGNNNLQTEEETDVSSELNLLIKKISNDIEHFSFNTAIAHLMKFIKYYSKDINQKDWDNFLILLFPFAPFVSQELWSQHHSNKLSEMSWPIAIDRQEKTDEIFLPVTMNGKLITKISILNSLSDSKIKELVLSNIKIKNRLKEVKILKIIIIPLKIINIVCKIK